MQEHEYKARDKTVQKMSRDGLREENLRNKEEKRITGRDTDTEISRSEKKEELDFSKRRHERLKEEREMEQPEQSSRKPRYSREHVSDQDINSDMDEEVEISIEYQRLMQIVETYDEKEKIDRVIAIGPPIMMKNVSKMTQVKK